MLEHISIVDAGTCDNHSAVAFQTSNRSLHVGERTVYLGFAICKPVFFSASVLRDVHAVEDLRYNLRAVFRHVLRNRIAIKRRVD